MPISSETDCSAFSARKSEGARAKAGFELFLWPTKMGIASSVKLRCLLLIALKRRGEHRAKDPNDPIGPLKSVFGLTKDVDSTLLPV